MGEFKGGEGVEVKCDGESEGEGGDGGEGRVVVEGARLGTILARLGSMFSLSVLPRAQQLGA